MNRFRFAICCLFVALSVTPMLFAQGGQSGAIQGTVADSSGAVVPGVTITIKDLGTSFERVVISESNGGYVFPNLNPGEYSLRAEMAGFAAFVVEKVTVNVGRTTDVNVRLEPAGTQETITVTGAAPLVETTKTDVGGVVDNREVEDLPLNGRNFSSLATLIPGARPTSSWDPTKTRMGAVSLGGGAGRNVNTTIDGIDNKDNTVGGYVQNITLEGVKEFALKTQRFSAADGRSQGGLLSIVTKSGTNDFHGSWFTFFRDKALNANDYFSIKNNVDKPDFRRWQYGGSFGGPIKKDKAFFFFTYERLQEDQFAIFAPNDVAELDLMVKNNISIYGAQPVPLTSLPQPYRSDMWTARMDWVINSNNNFYMSWNNSKDNTLNDQGATDGTSTNFNKNRNYLFSAVWNSTVSSRMVNQFVFGHSYWNNLIDSEQFSKVTVYFPTTGFGLNGNVPQQSYQKKWQFKDGLSWSRGAHSLRFGVDWLFQPTLGGFFRYNAVPALTFFDNPSDILNNKDGLYPQGFETPGIISALTGTAGDPYFNNQKNIHQFAWYVQDDWRATRKLTLNLGVRYDVDVNLLAPYEQTTNRTYLILKQIDNPYTNGWVNGLPQNDRNNFAPRVGFAFDPKGNGSTVIRGGYGIYFDQPFLNIALFAIQQGNQTVFGTALDQSSPSIGTGQLANFIVNQTPLPPLTPSTELEVGGRGRIVSPTYVSPMGQQWNLGVSQQLFNDYVLEIDYTHMLNLHESKTIELNPTVVIGNTNPRFLASSFVAAGLPANRLNRISAMDSVGRSRYDGLNVGLRKRLSHRITFQTSYTLSKAQGYGGCLGTFGCQARYDQFDYLNSKELAPTANDERHRFVFSSVFDLPLGLQVSPIFQLGSARPYTVTAGTDLNKDGANTDICVPGSVQSNGNVCPANAGINSQRGGYDLDGNWQSGRLFVMDLRVSKFFNLSKVREGMNIGFFFESFNLTNRTNFGANFSGNVRSGQFELTQGLATGTYGIVVAAPYQAQLGFRFTF